MDLTAVPPLWVTASAATRPARLSWLTALRDATALKTAYAFGLRRRELVMLDLADLGANPQAREFGEYGVVFVRWGKASSGSPPKRRSVLTVFPWSARVLGQWAGQFRGLFDHDAAGQCPSSNCWARSCPAQSGRS